MLGVILCGGKGTRLAPQTNNQNKHLLPIYTKNNGAVPMVHYPLNTLKRSGITEILIISSQEHCGSIMDFIGDGYKFGLDITYKIQDTNHVEMGIASALKIAKNFTNDKKFAVILGDNFFENSFEKEIREFENGTYSSHIFLKAVTDPERFGVAEVDHHTNSIIKLVEKPKEPKSNLACSGLYLFDKNVYDVANTLVLSQRNELEIVDILNYYIKENNIKYSIIKDGWMDMGTIPSMHKTTEYINKINYKIEF